MEGNEKKPPIEIKKVREEEEERRPGPLEYVGEHERRPKKPSTGINWVQVLLSVVIALVLSGAIMFQFFGKDISNLSANQDELVNRINSVASDLGGETTRINNIVNTQGDYAKKAELTGYVKAADAISVTKVKEIYESRVATLEAKVKGLEDRVTELETGPSAEDGDDVVTCDLDMWGDIILPTGSDHLASTLKATIVNTSSSELEDVVFTIVFMASSPTPTIDTVSLGGGMTTWNVISSGPWGVAFQNSWGLDLDANEKKKLMLTLDIVYLDVAAHSIMFDTEMEVEDYDVK